MEIKNTTKLMSLKEWLDRDGLTCSYSGGGDSGCFEEIEIGDNSYDFWDDTKHYPENSVERAVHWIANKIDDLTNYGSWAGGFDAHGTISYNKELGLIIVEDTYNSEEDPELEKVVSLYLRDVIPEHILKTIDAVRIVLHRDELDVNLVMTTGVWTDEHNAVHRDVVEYIEERMGDYLSEDYCTYHESETSVNDLAEIQINVMKGETTETQYQINPLDYEQKVEIEEEN